MERNLKNFKNDCIEKYFSSYQKYLENVFYLWFSLREGS